MVKSEISDHQGFRKQRFDKGIFACGRIAREIFASENPPILIRLLKIYVHAAETDLLTSIKWI